LKISLKQQKYSLVFSTLLQIAFSAVAMGPRLANEDDDLPPGLEDVPWGVYLLAAISPLVVFLVNELVKLQEIK